MRLTTLLAASLSLSCAAEPAEAPAGAAGAPTSTAVTYDSPPPPPAVAAAPGGVGVVGEAEVRVVNAGPREVRFYGLRGGRRLHTRDLSVRRATVITPSGPQVLVLEPREDYYVAVTPFDVPSSARFDLEVDFVTDPAPPAVVMVSGFAPLATVEVAAFVPAPPAVAVVAPAPPAVRVRGGVRVNAYLPSPRVVVVAPPPPSVTIGFGIPTASVVIGGGHHHHGVGHGHHGRGRGRGHRRHH